MRHESPPFTLAELLHLSIYWLRNSAGQILLVVALLLSLPALVASLALRTFVSADPKELAPPLLVAFGLNALVSLVTWALASAAISWQVHETASHRRSSAGSAVRHALRRLPQLAWTIVVVAGAFTIVYFGAYIGFVAIAIGSGMIGVPVGSVALLMIFLALHVPAGVAACSFILFPQIVILEAQSGIKAFRRLWSLAAGFRLRLALLCFLFFVFGGFVVLLYQGVRLYSEAVAHAVAFILGLGASAYILVAQTLFYLKLRAYKEGYGLDLLATLDESQGAA